MNAVSLGIWLEAAHHGTYWHYIVVLGDDCFMVVRLPDGTTIYVYLDFVRWDAHFHSGAQSLKMRLYHRYGLVSGSPAHKALLQQANVHGRTALGHRYSVEATVESGVSDTSVGNSHQNGMMCAYALTATGFPANLSDFPSFQRVLEDLGFPSEGGYTRDLYAADFCSAIFLPSSTGHRLSPKIGRVLSKTFFSDKNRTMKGQLQWLRGVLIGLDPAVAHIPILRAVFSRLIVLTDGITPKKYRVSPLYLGIERASATQDTFDAFYSRYDVNQTECLAIEDEISRWPHPQQALSGQPWLHLFHVDMCSTLTSSLHAITTPLRSLLTSLAPHIAPLYGAIAINTVVGLIAGAFCTHVFRFHPSILFLTYFGQIAGMSLISAPITEEIMKRRYPSFTAVLSLVEAYGVYCQRGLYPACARVIVHHLMAALPLPLAIPTHFCFNLTALACALLGHSPPVLQYLGITHPSNYDSIWAGFEAFVRTVTYNVGDSATSRPS
jgi:hypothetical protein